MEVTLVRKTADDGTELWALTLGRCYPVLGIEGGWFRLRDDTHKPYLYPPECFVMTDASIPAFWVCQGNGEDSSWYPGEWNRPGFFEDCFEGSPTALSEFRRVYERYYQPGTIGKEA